MNKYDYAKEYIKNLSADDFVELFNDFCRETGEDDAIIHPMHEFNTKTMDLDLTPIEVAEIGGSCMFDSNDNYFTVDWWEEFYSADDPLELADNLLEQFADYIVDNDLIEYPEENE